MKSTEGERQQQQQQQKTFTWAANQRGLDPVADFFFFYSFFPPLFFSLLKKPIRKVESRRKHFFKGALRLFDARR